MTSVQNSQTKETKNNSSVYRLVVFILLSIFIAQILIHFIFHIEQDFKHFGDMIISAFLMVIFLFPVLYRFVVQPMLIEISQRKQAEKDLRESKERLETLLHSLPFGILIMDSETHKIVEANPQAVLMIGAPADHIIGSDSHKFIYSAEKGACPDTDPGQDIDNSERELLTATGGKLPVLKTAIPIELDGRNCLIECFIDITDRKHAEAERMGREKLQGIIEMSGAVCHELNQPLQSVSTYSELLMMDMDKENPSYEKIKEIKGQVDRMGKITKKLMHITKYETKGYLRGQIIDIDKASK